MSACWLPIGSGSGYSDKVLFLGPNGRSILLSDNANGRDGIWKTDWWECIIDNKFVDYQDRESVCGNIQIKIQIGILVKPSMASHMMKQRRLLVKRY